MPKVSVNLPCYNDSKWIEGVIRNILNQTYQDFEIIIVDGSTDNSKEIIQKYLSDKRLRYIYQEDRGFSAAMNRSLKESRGEYVAFMSPDDLWLPRKLEKQVAFLERNKDIAMVHSDAYHIDSKGNIFGQRRPKIPHNLSKKELVKRLFLRSIEICHQTVMVRNDCFRKVGYFDENLIVSDYDMWIRIAGQFNLGYVNEPLTKKRYHQSQQMARKFEKLLIDEFLLANKAIRLYPFLEKYGNKKFAKIYYLWAIFLLLRRQKEHARMKLFMSLKLNPYGFRRYWAYLFPSLYIKIFKLYRKRIPMLTRLLS